MSLNNKFKILYFNKNGIELDTFLRQSGSKLKNTRIFYIVSAKMDNHEIYKIGLSERGENSAFGRLKDYIHFYWKENNENEKQGVKIYVCLANTFNADVANPDAAVRKIETQMKRDFKDFTIQGRGNERFKVNLEEIFTYLEENGITEKEDTEKPTRKTPRIAETNIGSNDAVEAILGHKISKKTGIKFLVRFKPSRIYDRDQNSTLGRRQNAYLFYDDIVQLRDGKITLDMYVNTYILKK